MLQEQTDEGDDYIVPMQKILEHCIFILPFLVV